MCGPLRTTMHSGLRQSFIFGAESPRPAFKRGFPMPVNSVEALKARFNTAIDDRKVTKQEVEEMIELVKDGGGVTNSERRQIREQFIVSGDVFEADAKERMSKFISDEIPTLLIDDPVVGGDTGNRTDLAD